MIKKLEKRIIGENAPGMVSSMVTPTAEQQVDKINELVCAVNRLETMAKNTNTVLESLVKENNIHEKQIDELQIKVEPEKCKTPTEDVPDLAIQFSWIGHLCRFWDYSKFESTYAILDDINVWCEHPYRKSNGNQYKHCEPVKPDDYIIYKGDNNE